MDAINQKRAENEKQAHEQHTSIICDASTPKKLGKHLASSAGVVDASSYKSSNQRCHNTISTGRSRQENTSGRIPSQPRPRTSKIPTKQHQNPHDAEWKNLKNERNIRKHIKITLDQSLHTCACDTKKCVQARAPQTAHQPKKGGKSGGEPRPTAHTNQFRHIHQRHRYIHTRRTWGSAVN